MITLDHQNYFNAACFFDSIFDIKKLPTNSIKEIALAGRSNVGKSSIINAITQKKELAAISKTPGRTKSINYFILGQNRYLVDLPGYGYAKVSQDVKLFWETILEKYFLTRKSLVGVILIMDIRHPLKLSDQQMLSFCTNHNLPLHIVLNKEDQLNKHKTKSTLEQITNQTMHLKNRTVQTLSTLHKTGIKELQQKIYELLN